MGALARTERFVRSWRLEPEHGDRLAGAMNESDDVGSMDYLTVPDLLDVLRYARAAAQGQAVALTHRAGCDCDLCEVLIKAGLSTQFDSV